MGGLHNFGALVVLLWSHIGVALAQRWYCTRSVLALLLDQTLPVRFSNGNARVLYADSTGTVLVFYCTGTIPY